MSKVNLPSVLTEKTHFYKEYESELKPYLGRKYVSYSTCGSVLDYEEDFIKNKLLGIKSEGSVYVKLGSWFGEACETGVWPSKNPEGFTGKENIDLSKIRKKGDKYEKLIIIDRGEYIVVGFIDIWRKDSEGKVEIRDIKTGADKKVKEYQSLEYTQVVLYAHAEELKGEEIGYTGVEFFERTGSHVKPPLNLSGKYVKVPLEYNEERVKYALSKIDKAVEKISSLYTTWKKIVK